MMLNRFPRLYTGLAMLLLCFEQLTFCVKKQPVAPLDVACSKFIQSGASPLLDKLMFAISIFEQWPFMVSLALSMAFLFYRFDSKRTARYVFLSFVVAFVANLLAKQVIYRPRPAANLVRVLAKSHSSSFPSGTVIVYFVFFGFLIVLCQQPRGLPRLACRMVMVISIILISIIGYARIYLGAHWLSDVLGGYLAGAIVLMPFVMYYLKRAEPETKHV